MEMVKSFLLTGRELDESRHYELCMLVREFLPLAEIITDDTAPADLRLCWDGEAWLADTGNGYADREMSGEASALAALGGDPFKNELKRSLYRLLARLTGMYMPWGILTGVRPTKLAWQAMTAGYTAERLIDALIREFYLEESKARRMTEIACREQQLLADHLPTDISIYAGIPFCPTRCAYCSFVSYDYHRLGDLMDRYVDTLIAEIRECGRMMQGRRFKSFYMGGGTPTTLSPDAMDRVLSAVEEAFGEMSETTVEAGRPDTITSEKLRVLKRHGIGRISVNPQTMNDATLVRIGRRHSVEDILRAFALARDAGFDNINMDLIMGLPGETSADAAHTLERIMVLAPESLTVHTLAVKRSSRIREQGFVSETGPEEIRQMLRLADEAADALGMKPYYMYRQKNMAGNFENTGYAVPGKECLYNIEIMEEKQSILAMGAGAVSKCYEPEKDRLTRVPNVKNVEEYLRRIDEMLERKRRRFV